MKARWESRRWKFSCAHARCNLVVSTQPENYRQLSPAPAQGRQGRFLSDDDVTASSKRWFKIRQNINASALKSELRKLRTGWNPAAGGVERVTKLLCLNVNEIHSYTSVVCGARIRCRFPSFLTHRGERMHAAGLVCGAVVAVCTTLISFDLLLVPRIQSAS